jgi:hypothetical protein
MAPSDSGSSVSQERPHVALRGVGQAPAAEVLEEPGLVDRHQRPQPHRHRRELPERRHQPGVRIGRQASAPDLLAEPVELLLGHAPLQEGPGIEPRRRMPLEIDEVTAVGVGRGVPKVHLADVVERRRRLEAGDVPPELGGFLVGPQHRGQCVPPDQRPDAVLDRPVTGMTVLPLRRDRVQIGRVRRIRHRRPPPAPLAEQLVEQEEGPLSPFELQDGVERLDPLPRLDGIRVKRHATPLPGESAPPGPCYDLEADVGFSTWASRMGLKGLRPGSHIRLLVIEWGSTYSPTASGPSSRPTPLCLTPPKGASRSPPVASSTRR